MKLKDIPLGTIVANKSYCTVNLNSGETYMTGSGGGKSKGGREAVEADNTLRSAAVVRIVEVVSEGPIVGICGGARGILINSTPLQNQDGSYNFPRVAWDYRVGLPVQDYMPGFPSASSEINVSAPVLTSTPVIRSTSSANVDAVKVIIQLPEGLSAQNTKNGDLNGTNVSFRIDRKRTADGNWATVDSYTISGKTTSPYEAQYRIQRPAGTGAWDIRVVRLTADADKSSLHNKIAWARMTEIQDVKLGFEDTAVIGMAIDAESVGSSIPTRAYMIKGRIIAVPTNYNPETNVYTGFWNGTFKQAWTDNGAWVLYDLLTHERYGMGEFIDNADIDIYSFYDAAVYNDGLVPNGKGGTERRYTFSTLINTQESATKILQMVAGSFASTLVQINGKWTVLQDRPTSPARNIGNSAVINGEFVYKSSGLFDRHTAFNVSWNDRSDRYLLKTSVTEDLTGIARYGYMPFDLAAYGATTEGQAIRKGKWALETELHQTELVNFRMGMNGFDLINNDIVRIFDEDYTETLGQGRVVAAIGSKVTLDQAIPVQTGSSITFTYADGTTNAEFSIVNPNETTNVIFLDSPLLQPVLESSIYIVTNAVEARQFKILNLTYPEPGQVEIEAVFHDPNKYSRVELGINIPAPVYSDSDRVTDTVVVAPTDLIFVEQAIRNDDGTITRSLLASWTPSTTGSLTTGYFVQYRRSEDSTVYDRTPVPAYTIPVSGDGVYEFAVTAYDGANRTAGQALVGTYTINAETLSELSGITNFYVKSTSSLLWNSSDLVVTWQSNTANLQLTQDYEVTVRTAGDALLHTEIVTGTEFTYTLNQNRADHLRLGGSPSGTLKISVTPRDFFSRKGATTIATFVNAPPAQVSGLTVYTGYQSANIQWQNLSEPDVVGYLVWRGLTPGFAVSQTNLIGEGLINTFKDLPLTDSTTYYYKVAAYDIFSRNVNGTGLSITSSLGSTTTPGANVNEYNLSGVTFQPNFPTSNKVGWSNGQVAQSLGAGAGTIWSVSAGEAEWVSGVLYIYYKSGDTFLSSSNTLTDAIGASKVIVATYRGGNKLEVGYGNAYTDGSLIIAGTVATAQLAVGAVKADNMQVSQLSAISADMGQITAGNITLDPVGYVRGGQVAYGAGDGFYIGASEGLYKLSFGSNVHYLRYNGANNIDMSCNLNAASGSFAGTLLAGVLDFSKMAGDIFNYEIPGTYTLTVPVDKSTMRVSLCAASGGGGGGGGSSSGYSGGGGGGGATNHSVYTLTGLAPGTTFTLVIGSKGLGGGVGGHGTAGGASSLSGVDTLLGGGGGEAGRPNRGGSAVGGAGANGGGNGAFGGATYLVQRTDYPSNYDSVGGKGGGGGVAAGGGNNGGSGGRGWRSEFTNSTYTPLPGDNGQHGKATVEFFNPNTVVIKTEYNTLLAALQRQGIAII